MQKANKNMHIAHIVFAFYPYMNLGGVPRSVFDLTRAQGNRYRLTVITNKIEEFRKQPLGNMDVIYLKNLSRKMIYKYQFYTPLISGSLISAIKGADVLHFHGHRNLLNDLVVLINRFFDKPYIITTHGTLLNYESKKGLKELYDRTIGNTFLNNAKYIIAHSEIEKKEIIRSYPDLRDVLVIPNGIFVSDLKERTDLRNFYEKYRISFNKRILLFIGKITRRKGLEVCLDAFRKIDRDDLQLVIAGEIIGYDINRKFKNLPNVKYIGHLDIEDKLNAISAAEIVLYPTVYEAFGYVPFESILLDRPCIVGDDFGTSEHLSPVVPELVISYGDSIELADLIVRLMKDSHFRNSLVKRGKGYILDNYSMESVVEAYDRIYRRVRYEI